MENLGKIERKIDKGNELGLQEDGCHPLSSKYIWRQPKDETTPIT
jgi:hypothetical protein